MGLEGPELLNFVSEQQIIEREERAKERELRMIEIEQKNQEHEATVLAEKLAAEERERDAQ